MHDEPLQNILHPRVRIVTVDPDHVLGDVVDGEVHQGWDFDLGRVHLGSIVSTRLVTLSVMHLKNHKHFKQAQSHKRISQREAEPNSKEIANYGVRVLDNL